MLSFISVLLTVFCFVGSSQASLRERPTPDGRRVFDVLLANGAPPPALDLLFHFFDYNRGRINNRSWAVIVDYSQPSLNRRLLLLDLRAGNIETHHVAHGISSGVLEARHFSNMPNSRQSSVGFFYALGDFISSKYGSSLKLYGIDSSNNRARDREMSLFGADYVSDEFIQRNGRLGWSRGDLVVSTAISGRLVDLLKEGSVILAYHPELMSYSRRSTHWQDLLGREDVPIHVHAGKAPGEAEAVSD